MMIEQCCLPFLSHAESMFSSSELARAALSPKQEQLTVILQQPGAWYKGGTGITDYLGPILPSVPMPKIGLFQVGRFKLNRVDPILSFSPQY